MQVGVIQMESVVGETERNMQTAARRCCKLSWTGDRTRCCAHPSFSASPP